MYIVKDLAECWRECPKSGTLQALSQSRKELYRKKDEEFLHSLGVRFPDEAETEIPGKS